VKPPAVGIFVGGEGRRMGGVAKGLLQYQGRSLVERLLHACQAAPSPEALSHVYLVGNAVAYSATQIPLLADDPAGRGPMGGLRSLLLEAHRRGLDAVALAVDMPYVDAALVRRLFRDEPAAAALAPRQDGRWQPLFARYRPGIVLPVVDAALGRDRTSLQVIFDDLQGRGAAVAELRLGSREREALRDWDRPSDMDGTVPGVEP
jgi:molybdopterin-guanine dinucleotide biosynthesis protein A